MPVIERLMRLCEWCGLTCEHERWVKTEVYETRDGKDVTVFKRFYKCSRCGARTSE